MAAPLPVPTTMLAFDLWVMLGAAVLIIPAMFGWIGISRLGGVVLLVLYGAYLVAQVLGVPDVVADKLGEIL